MLMIVNLVVNHVNGSKFVLDSWFGETKDFGEKSSFPVMTRTMFLLLEDLDSFGTLVTTRDLPQGGKQRWLFK